MNEIRSVTLEITFWKKEEEEEESTDAKHNGFRLVEDSNNKFEAR